MNDSSHNIEIADQQTQTLDFQPLISAAGMILDDYGIDQSEISIALVDDVSIRQLNNQYLGHDYETDVISFVLDQSEASLTGQLIVSTDTAARIGKSLGVSLEDETLLYVIHGTLHLVGFDDTDDESAEKMRAAEKDYLARFNIAHRWETTDRAGFDVASDGDSGEPQ